MFDTVFGFTVLLIVIAMVMAFVRQPRRQGAGRRGTGEGNGYDPSMAALSGDGGSSSGNSSCDPGSAGCSGGDGGGGGGGD
jgi:hypothetical protein